MHELKLVRALFNDLISIAQKNNAKRIKSITIRMGEFSEITPEVVAFYFKDKSKNTIAEAAEIIFEKSPNRELRLVSFDYE